MAKNRNKGAVLIIMLLLVLIFSIMATAFVTFQINDRRISEDDINSMRAYYMADSGIQVAFAKITRDTYWQGQDVYGYERWVYEDGARKYGFHLNSEFDPLDSDDPDTYNYYVRSVGVVMDKSYNPPRLIASRSLKAYIQCQSDYNQTHAGGAKTHYTKVGEGSEAILWRQYDEFK